MRAIEGKGKASGDADNAAQSRRTRAAQSGQSVARDMPWARVFAPSGISRRRAAFIAMEVVVATIALLVVCRFVDPADPLLVRTGFGWV
jgi:hypothetical protein